MRNSGVFSEDAEDLALNAHVGCCSVDRGHLLVRGLKADHGALAVKALEGGVSSVDQGDDDLALTSRAGTLDQDVVAIDDVFVSHRVAADFKGEDLAVTDDVAQRDGLGGFDGFDGLARGDAAKQGQAVVAFLTDAGGQHVDRTAAIMRALEEALVLQIGDVLVNSRERVEAETGGDLLVGGGVSVLDCERGEKVDYFFLSPGDSHAVIVANKKRIASAGSRWAVSYAVHFRCKGRNENRDSYFETLVTYFPVLKLARVRSQGSWWYQIFE